MKHMAKIVLLFAFIALPAFSAESEEKVMGSYCNATTYSGAWAIFFNEDSVGMNCDRVDAYLRSHTPSPINHRISGGYYVDASNDVWLDCRGFTGEFTGYGEAPIQQALYTAESRRYRDCLFFINFD